MTKNLIHLKPSLNPPINGIWPHPDNLQTFCGLNGDDFEYDLAPDLTALEQIKTDIILGPYALCPDCESAFQPRPLPETSCGLIDWI